jgi:hypothetical protein
VKHNDEIRWISRHGTVDVEFPGGTPFAQEVKHGDGQFRAVAADEGKFTYNCTITTPDGKKHGWPQTPEGGGTVEVGTGSRTGAL